MNKKILIGIAIVIVASATIVVGLKTTLGDKVLALPGEEHTEKSLNLQESNSSSAKAIGSNGSASTESSESGP